MFDRIKHHVLLNTNPDIPEGTTCQEASPLSSHGYIPCGAPASKIVLHEKDRRAYYMCGPCADHNVRNRGGKLVTKDSSAYPIWTKEEMLDAIRETGLAARSRETMDRLGRQRGPELPKPARYDSFPLTSQFSKADMSRANELMEEDLALQEQEKAVQEARASIKTELAEIAERNDCARPGGFRWGQMAVYYKPGTTRRTLKADLLVEKCYCTAEQIEECKVPGNPYLDLRVVDLSKPVKPKEWE